MRRPFLALTVLLAALSAACASTQAKTRMAEAAALDPPPPPARVIAPLEPDEVEGTTDTTRPPTTTRPSSPPARPAPAAPPREATPTKPEPEPVKPPEPVVETPPPTVHRLQPPNEAEQEKSIRDRIATAESDLSRVDYRALSATVKEQYDTAKRLTAQAKDALKARNLLFADSLADKAAAIAASLRKQ